MEEGLNEKLERLAVGQAIYKGMARAVSTKDPDSLRAECDEELRRRYEEDGVDRLRLRVNGHEVGTLSAKVSKAVERKGVRVTDPEEFRGWLVSEGQAYMEELVDRRFAELLDIISADDLVPDGCEVWSETVPEHFVGTTLRVDVAKVGDALGGELPAATFGLLMEGE